MNRIITLLLLCLTLSSCQSLSPSYRSNNLENYHHFFSEVDRTIKAFDVVDASTFPVDSYPPFKVNRTLIGAKKMLSSKDDKNLWMADLIDITLQSKTKEIQNLPVQAIHDLNLKLELSLTKETFKKLYSKNLTEYSKALVSELGSVDKIFNEAKDPGEYSIVMRTLGIYPLYSLIIKAGAKAAYEEFEIWHDTSFDQLEKLGDVNIYSFNSKNNPTSNIPSLFEKFAPIIYQDTTDSYDIPGKVNWKDDKVSVNTSSPTVYFYKTYSFINNKTYQQLNYTFWYESRSGKNTPWIEKGRLDGNTIRITIDDQEQPIMVDIMNNCGCYHQLIPSNKFFSIQKQTKKSIKPLVPAWLPNDYPEKSLKFFITSGWHQTKKVFTESYQAKNNVSYQLLPYDILENLPKENGQTESVFNKHGIMKNSTRIEHVIFFPAGIPKVGFMRQRGNHPTTLVGREYFTNPFLFEENFEINH